eukprot:TRINITY_DN3140_c0_g1_i5.p1 TRINITY_DN3140_c0_g1~~TRINITY_DN3140_c0_g1_i5.p1  ORF type:complete len:199 (-),score=12.71 TRINITY_DN3140_c0_g1_i5:39-635(-)
MEKLVETFGLIYLMRGVDFTNPENIFRLRVLYGISLLIQIIMMAITFFQIISKKDSRIIRVPAKPSLTNPTPEPGQFSEQTVYQYDMEQLRSTFFSTAFGVGLLFFLHLKFGFMPPLFLQAFSQPISFFDQKLVKIHLRGFPAEGDLERPFKAPASANPLAALFGGQQPEAEAAPAAGDGAAPKKTPKEKRIANKKDK